MTHGWGAIVALVSIWVATEATAQPAPLQYAVHPILVLGEAPAATQQKLQAALEQSLWEAGVARAPEGRISEFLSKQPRERCESNECLAEMARVSGAQFALRIAAGVRPAASGGDKIVISGKIINPAGTEVDSRFREYSRNIGTSELDGMAAAIERFVRIELALGEPELGSLTNNPPPTIVTEVKYVEAKRPAWVIPAGTAAAAVAVGAAGVGIWRHATAFANWGELHQSENQQVTLARRNELAALRAGASAAQTQAAVAYIVAGAAASAAGFLFAYSPKAKPEEAQAAPAAWLTPSGAGVVFAGSF